MSYAKDSKASDVAQRIADFNHFVIFDPRVSTCYSPQSFPTDKGCYRCLNGGTLL